MSDPFNHPFLQKNETMYLSSICKLPHIQPNRILPPPTNPSIASHPFSSMISLALLPKYSYQKTAMLLTSPSQPILNQSPIATNISIKNQIRSISMILKELGLRPRNSELKELLTLCVPSICCLRLQRS